jgi:hypothetical protein
LPDGAGNINTTRTTSPILSQTKYTLECTDQSNAPMAPKSVTVKLVPSFREF